MLGEGLHLQTRQLQPSLTFRSGCFCGKWSFIGSCVTPRNNDGSSWKMQARKPLRGVLPARSMACAVSSQSPYAMPNVVAVQAGDTNTSRSQREDCYAVNPGLGDRRRLSKNQSIYS